MPQMCPRAVMCTPHRSGGSGGPACLAPGSRVWPLCTSGGSGASIINEGKCPDAPLPPRRLASSQSLVLTGVGGHHSVRHPAAQMGPLGKARESVQPSQVTGSPPPCHQAAGTSSFSYMMWVTFEMAWVWPQGPVYLPAWFVACYFGWPGKLSEAASCVRPRSRSHALATGSLCLSFPVVWRECP